MKKEPNKKLVGLFLVVGFILLLGLIGQSISDKVNADTRNMVVMYFNESLQGLSEGSPIVFQGVEVGKVSRIQLVTDKKNLKFTLAVYARLKEIDITSRESIFSKFWKKESLLEILIEKGMRARLATQSYLMGQLMIELVMLPDTEVKFNDEAKSDGVPQIPTVLSKKEEIVRGLDTLQIQETMTRFNRVTEVLGKELPVLLPALTQSAKNLDKTLAKIEGSSDTTIANLNEALLDISKAAKTLQSMDETISNVNATLGDVSDAAKSLQNLTDYLERHPESLIQGKKGE